MARIRTIKPEFWTSEQLAECSPTARLLFVGIWTFADDGGVHPDSAKRLKMEIFPADDFSADDVGKLLQELLDAGLISRFETEGQSYLWVTGWHHQKIDRPTYRHPQPPLDDSSSNARRGLAETPPNPHPRSRVESSRVEGNGVEGTSIDRSGARSTLKTQFPKTEVVRGGEVWKAHLPKFFAVADALGNGRELRPRDRDEVIGCVFVGTKYLPQGQFDGIVDELADKHKRGELKKPFAVLRQSMINEFAEAGLDFHKAIKSFVVLEPEAVT